jgi:hypothetical protein
MMIAELSAARASKKRRAPGRWTLHAPEYTYSTIYHNPNVIREQNRHMLGWNLVEYVKLTDQYRAPSDTLEIAAFFSRITL